MRKLILSAAALFMGVAVFGQTNYPCVVKSNGHWKLSNYSHEDGDFGAPSLDFGNQYTKNTFLKFPDRDEYAYATYDGTSSVIHIVNNEGGHYKNTRLYEHVLSLNYSAKDDKLVYLSTAYVPNYYDFLSQDISITILDLKNNTAKNVKIPTFSIYVPTLPYVGVRERVDNRRVTQRVNYSISLPTINTDLSEFMFVAADIPGINRLVRLNLNTNVVTTTVVGESVLSLVYSNEKRTVKALIYEMDEAQNETRYFVGDLDHVTGKVSKKVQFASIDKTLEAEMNGSIHYEHESGKLFVSKVLGTDKMIYEISLNSNRIMDENKVIVEADINIPLPRSATQVFGLSHFIKVYPNPTAQNVTIETVEERLVDHITVLDASGRQVKSVSVQSGLVSNEIDLSRLSQGIYYIEIQAQDQTHIEKIVKY